MFYFLPHLQECIRQQRIPANPPRDAKDIPVFIQELFFCLPPEKCVTRESIHLDEPHSRDQTAPKSITLHCTPGQCFGICWPIFFFFFSLHYHSTHVKWMQKRKKSHWVNKIGRKITEVSWQSAGRHPARGASTTKSRKETKMDVSKEVSLMFIWV